MESFKVCKSINIGASGKGCQLRLGDIDGDGRMEFVMVKPNSVPDERYFAHKALAISAYSIDNELLWQIGTPNSEASPPACDVPVQIYDIDKDGKNEVIAVIDDQLYIFDGKTSEVKKQITLPDKHIGGNILICDLEGSGYAQNIILKNKFSHIWALDVNLNVIWDFEGNIGLCPVAYDINNDGKDEIIAGYNVLNGAGELLWKVDMPGHAKSICVDNLFKKDIPTIIISGPFIRAYLPNGECQWQIDESASNIAISNFRDNTKNKDFLVFDNLSLFDHQGNFLYEKNETIYAPSIVWGFDNTKRVYIAGRKKDDIFTTLYDGYMRPVYTIDSIGNITSGDINGSGNSQVIIYGDETLYVYSLSDEDLSVPSRPYALPQLRQHYNVSVYNTLPTSQNSQGYLADDFAAQNILKWAETYASLNMHNSYAKVSRSEFVLLIATMLNIKEEFSENFADVLKDTTYYEAVGAFKALNIIDSEDNLFRPSDTITVALANDILDNLSMDIFFGFDERYELSKQDLAKFILTLSSKDKQK